MSRGKPSRPEGFFYGLGVNDRDKFLLAINQFSPDLILSDHALPNFSSHEALKMVRASRINVPFILITAAMTDEFAVKIMKEGAYDYIIKDRLSRLPSAIINMIEKFRLKREKTTEREIVSKELANFGYT